MIGFTIEIIEIKNTTNNPIPGSEILNVGKKIKIETGKSAVNNGIIN